VQFDWDEGNRSHIERHGVTTAEAEEALKGHLLYDPPYVRNDEVRANVRGRTWAGRVLAIVFTQRGAKLRVVTARDAKRKERKLYAQYEKGQSA
jgi:uncharacterized protein